MVEISRSKDGVPQWSGDAASYQEYEKQALQWEQSIAHGKRYLCGPRMIQEMSGTARKLVTGKRPDWLSFNGGVVRRSLGRPQIPELSEYLNKYFKQSRRRKSMNQYIVRKTEVYHRAKQALARSCPISSATLAMTIAGRDLHGGQACGVGHGRVLLQAKMIGPVEARATQTRKNHGQILGLMSSTGRAR